MRNALRYFLPVPLVFVSACGNRQPAPAQPVTSQAIQSGQPAVSEPLQAAPQPAPAVPAQPAPYQAAPPQAPPALPPATSEAVKPSPLRRLRTYTPPEPAEPPERAAISIPAGTVFNVRLDDTLDTRTNGSGDPFTATLVKPIFVNQRLVVPRGTACSGHITESMSSGRFKGRAVMDLSLDSFEMNGRRYQIHTAHAGRQSGGHKKRNWLLIGGGSGLGSAIGAIAAGPAGALIGAGAGAAAGTTGAALTGKKKVHLAAETQLAFSLRAPVRLEN